MGSVTVWFLVGNRGMDYGGYYWGVYRGYYKDPFPHSLLSTRQIKLLQGFHKGSIRAWWHYSIAGFLPSSTWV